VESTCRRYISQILNLALGAAKNYQEKEALQWTKRVLRYAKYVSGTVDADGNLFSEADKKQMIACCSNELRLGSDAELQRMAEEQGDVAEKLRQMIVLSRDFVPPTEPLDKMAGNDISVAWG
jgi:predicted component of type VI protein secretion system